MSLYFDSCSNVQPWQRLRSRWIFWVTLLLVALPLAAQADETWPVKPTRLVVPLAAGSAPDIVARLLANKLGAALGQPMIVDDRPGAGTIIGAQYVARSSPDGYTLLFAPGAVLVTNPYTFKNLSYDPITDFVPIGLVGQGPFVILVNPKLPVHNLAELFALDKKDPHTLSIATDNPKQFSGMLAAWLNQLGGATIDAVPYVNMTQGLQDVLEGRVQAIILALPIAMPHIASNALRPLAVSWAKRAPNLPNVPAVAETFPGVDISGWFMVATPKKTPESIVNKLNEKMDDVLKDPELKAKLADLGYFTDGALTPGGAQKFLQSQYDSWGKIIHTLGIKPE
jgi:tripartite-type tricarboxylate transporter receptor subunit TctC